MSKIISKKKALELGLKRFFTGRPCLNNHIDERQTSDDHCITCTRNNKARSAARRTEEQKEKKRRYRKKHHELRREHDLKQNKEWYRKNKKVHRANNKKWIQEHPEKSKEYSRRHYRKNRKKERARAFRLYYEGPLNPKGESQCRTKNLALLRRAKRLIKKLRQGLAPSQAAASMMPKDLPK